MVRRCSVPGKNERTAVSNRFIDDFLADAPGEYIKVYLFLLRHTGEKNFSLSLKGIGEQLGISERCTRDAFSYWEECGFLEIYYEGNRICDILVKEPAGDAQPSSGIDSIYLSEDTGEFSFYFTPEELSAPKTPKKRSVHPGEKDFSPSFVPFRAELLHDKDTRLILALAEHYMKKHPSAKEREYLRFWHEELKISCNSIENLLEKYVCGKGLTLEQLNQLVLRQSQGAASGPDVPASDAPAGEDLESAVGFIKKKLRLGRDFFPVEERFLSSWLMK